MHHMNSSLSMTMALQPELSPPRRQAQGWQSIYADGTISPYRSVNHARPSSAPMLQQHASSFDPAMQQYDLCKSSWYDNGRLNNEPTQFDVTISPRRPQQSQDTSRFFSSQPNCSPAEISGTLTVYPRVANRRGISSEEYDGYQHPYFHDYFEEAMDVEPPSQIQSRATLPHTSKPSFSQAPYYSSDQPPFLRSRKRMSSTRRETSSKPAYSPYEDVNFKVTVRTGDKPGGGTDAQVYVTLIGRKGIVPKWRLFKKSGQSNNKMFRFSQGSSHMFKHKGADVGEIEEIIIEHDGLSERDSWFLKEVVVENTKANQAYTFPCDQWLSMFKENGEIRRKLSAISGKHAKRTTYEITVVTGEERRAGTDANVYITLQGPKGTSPKLRLKSDKRKTFGRGQSDVFNVKTTDVGTLKKLRVEHDNQGYDPDWFLDRLVVVDIKTPSKKIYFPCGQWLSESEQLHRELEGSCNPLARSKMNSYVVTVFTGDKRSAGTDSNVHVILFGDQDNSGQQVLNNQGNNFDKGRKDTFRLSCPYLGRLKKIRIGHDNSGMSPSWFLDKVVVDDLMMSCVYTFPCQRWFAEDEDDGRITRELLPGKGDVGVLYTVRVSTGDVRGAGTDANVFIVLYGGRNGQQSSGKISLNGKFERKCVDVCDIESSGLLSPLSKIEIGHDDTGMAPGWFLDKVIVTCKPTGCEQLFSCRKWFATDEGDGLICRELYESKSDRKQVVRKSAWNCSIWTSDVRNAGTDANVYIQVYGDKGKSNEIALDNETDNFEAGQKDKFQVDIEDIGRIYKVRVWHDDTRPFSGWHLDKLVLEPMFGKKATGTPYTFNCQRWLAKDEEDGELVRELPATGAGIKRPEPVLRYLVTVVTGDKRTAGTDADVFCCIYGDQGDTGDRPLLRSRKNKNKFERKSVDEFLIEAVNLKTIRKVKIGHNDSGVGSGWFLEKVTVQEEGNSSSLKTFPCSRWLATDEDDGAIVRELLEEGSPQLLNTTSYRISVKTGNVRSAGTDANVFIKIFGEDGDTGRGKLHQSDNISNKFERGRTDLFTLEATDVGKLLRIQIGHDNSGMAAGWFLEGVEIDVPSKGMHYTFKCNRWLATDEGDGKTEVELYPTQTRQQDKLLPYGVTVTTGNKLNAGTDANVFLQLYGSEGKSEEIKLRNRTDNFERKAVDKFKIEALDVGPITKLRIGHDGKGRGSGWFLDSVKIQRFVKKTSKRKKKGRDSSITEDHNEVETYWFVTKRWFDKSEDDGQLVRELVPTDESGRPISDALEELEYKVNVYTGNKSGAGTDSNVFITLYGKNGDSGERKLDKSDNVNKFERNQKDSFIVKAADLSELTKLKIRHDNSNLGSAWFLDRVEVAVKDNVWIFPCQRWLSTTEDDGQIERTLVPVDQATYQRLQQQQASGRKASHAVRDAVALETKAKVTTYEVTVKTGDVRGAGTDANVHLVLYGQKDDSGIINLKSSKTYRNKFERSHSDVFSVESAELGNLKKIKIGHDNASLSSGWYLECVEVDAPSMGKKWIFPCGRWLDKDKDDGSLERELYPSADQIVDYEAEVPYEITVYTSDVSSAGTNSDVFIVLYGKNGLMTEKTSLCPNKDDRKSKFNRKSVDTFVLELEDIGKMIEKIRIGHNGKGFGAGWHLDKVEIRRLLKGSKGSETFLFECGRWLARDEDDGEIVRELVPTQLVQDKISRSGQMKRKESSIRDQLKNQHYEVQVFTGDKFNAGTDANVYLTIYGENGDTGERKLLKSETNVNKFERGQVDVFKMEAVDLGNLHKVDIRHDNALLNSSWFLDRVEVTDKDTDQKFIFPCERWLAKGKDDGKLSRTLYAAGYDGEMSTKRSATSTMSSASVEQRSSRSERPTIPYTVRVQTGSEHGASCEADAFIKIYGPQKNDKLTRRIVLQPPHQKFKRGTTETFHINAIDVGAIKKIELGHTGVDSRWFVETVTIDQPTLGKTYNFSCKKWFARDREDGLTARILTAEDAEKIKYKAKAAYEVTLYTGDVKKAGTDCLIKLDIHGAKGSASDIMIRKSEDAGVFLEKGSVDVVHIEMDDIAPLKKIRLSHDGKGQRPDWFCKKVELRDLKSGKVTVFPCDAWLSRTMGNKKLYGEFSASVGGRSIVKKTDYRIKVKTSDRRGGGTDANVFCILYGTIGDTGELRLKESETQKNKFERNSIDIFTFKDKLSVGDLEKFRVWHDNKGMGAGWHLEFIEVEDLSTLDKYMFPCNRWLADDEDDNQVIRELSCTTRAATPSRPSSPQGKEVYTVSIVTSDKMDAAAAGDAWIILYGESGRKSKKLELKNAKGKRMTLGKGQMSEFLIESKDLGNLKEISLGLTERERWHVAEVTIETGNGAIFQFRCNAWIDNRDGADSKGRLFQRSRVGGRIMTSVPGQVRYDVKVVTADEKGAGTDSNVFLTMYGENGNSGKFPLEQRFRDLFTRNQTDMFSIGILDLGNLTKIRLEHDDSGLNADWLCDHVVIRNNASGQSWTFQCGEWIGSERGNQLYRDFRPTSLH